MVVYIGIGKFVYIIVKDLNSRDLLVDVVAIYMVNQFFRFLRVLKFLMQKS